MDKKRAGKPIKRRRLYEAAPEPPDSHPLANTTRKSIKKKPASLPVNIPVSLPAAEVSAASESIEDKRVKAKLILDKYMKWSIGAGFVWLPYIDLLAVSGVQVAMLADLSKIYDVPFSKTRAKAIIWSLISGFGALTAADQISRYLWRYVPFAGLATRMVSSTAATYSIAKLFIYHYELGGTLFDLSPEKTREHFAKLYREGQLSIAKN